MKPLRTILLNGCVALFAFTVACNQGEEKREVAAIGPGKSGDKRQLPEEEEVAPIGFGKAVDKKRSADPRIDMAVDKGVAFLKKQLPQIENKRPGYAGLAALALLEGGLTHDDPDILKLAEMIRKAAPKMNENYDLAASLFFLNRWHESKKLNENDRAMARTFALRIIAGQLSAGTWSYSGQIINPDVETKLLASLENGAYKPTLQKRVTMSATQFSMLAVWGSRKHGIPVREPLLALAKYFHENQRDNGSWNYPGYSLTATSTCAGLFSLAMERALLQEDKESANNRPAPVVKKKADLDKAFAFVGKTVGRKKGDPGGGTGGYGGKIFDADAGGDLYFLWTLERLGVIYSRDIIGDRDWYAWGYPIVLHSQKADGSWHENQPHTSGGPLIDTCFAILFLKRSNIAKDLTDKLQSLSFLLQPPRLLLRDSRPRPA